MKVIDAQVHLWSRTVIPPGSGHRQVKSFSADELPGPLDAAGRLVLVRRLIREGYLLAL